VFWPLAACDVWVCHDFKFSRTYLGAKVSPTMKLKRCELSFVEKSFCMSLGLLVGGPIASSIETIENTAIDGGESVSEEDRNVIANLVDIHLDVSPQSSVFMIRKITNKPV